MAHDFVCALLFVWSTSGVGTTGEYKGEGGGGGVKINGGGGMCTIKGRDLVAQSIYR